MSQFETHREWRRLVNMTRAELSHFLAEYGHTAGLSPAQARAQGIRSGRDSARALLRMLPTGSSYAQALKRWSAQDWAWARRQVAFIKRARGMRGEYFTDRGPTRKLLALMLWGHDPFKA